MTSSFALNTFSLGRVNLFLPNPSLEYYQTALGEWPIISSIWFDDDIFFSVQGSSSSNEWLPEPVASSFGDGGGGDSSDGTPLKSEMETQDGKFDEY